MVRRKSLLGVALTFSLPLILIACESSDGVAGVQGPAGTPGGNGLDGAPGSAALIVQTILGPGDFNCPNGGVRIDSGSDTDGDGMLGPNEIVDSSFICDATAARSFNRIAAYPVCEQIDANCDTDTQTAAEIVAASGDGQTLVYTDSPGEVVGFVDISDPLNPVGLGTVAVGGEPTSVAVLGNLALVGVNTSVDFVNTSGDLQVIDIPSQTTIASIALAGQPDSVAISPDGTYAAVVIENERDEDLGDGAPPQLPAGLLQIIDLAGPVAGWAPVNVPLTGIADLYPGDPEPEYVDINAENVAVVTLQENNHIVIVDLATASVTADFSAGTVDLSQVDATEEDPAIISQAEMLSAVPREPDGVTWISNEHFVTADEGDLDGGSRGFTIFDTAGNVLFTSGNSNDHLTARIGHYPDARSGNKGNEPENADFGVYGGDRILVVASERSSVLFVYDMTHPSKPFYKQVLPAGVGPEGILTLPGRNLLIAASEEDARGDGIRSVLNIYAYDEAAAAYPTIISADRLDGTAIPWSALSGLAADPSMPRTLYSIEDSFYGQNRIFGIDITMTPAQLNREIAIVDTNDVFAGISAVALADPTVADDDPARLDVFDEADLALLINADKSVNIDPEGIAVASTGGFWIASEGAGTVGDATQPVNSLNFVFKTDATGTIESVVTLPQAFNDMQLRFGFEGVAEYNGAAYVVFQRVWAGDVNARIGVYDIAAATWNFLFYPLDAPLSQNGGWVGLSDITSLDNGEFVVVERDNQAGPDAAIKRLYRFNVTGLAPDSVVAKTLVRDLLASGDLAAAGGAIPEKIEGSAVTANGDVYIVNDNDGVDDNSGETQLINLGDIL